MAPVCRHPAHSLPGSSCPIRRPTSSGLASPSLTLTVGCRLQWPPLRPCSLCSLSPCVAKSSSACHTASSRKSSKFALWLCPDSWCSPGTLEGWGGPNPIPRVGSERLHHSPAWPGPPAQVLWGKDICRPCLSTDRGRRCGEPSRPRSRYTLSTSPWCRVVRLVSSPEDWKGVWDGAGASKVREGKRRQGKRETQTAVISCGLRSNLPVSP